MTPPELPPIAPDLRRRLTEDILQRGIIIPVIQTEDGEVLDGRLRLEIEADAKLVKAARYRVAQILGGRRAVSDADLVSG